jgi:hypothetical protein
LQVGGYMQHDKLALNDVPGTRGCASRNSIPA